MKVERVHRVYGQGGVKKTCSEKRWEWPPRWFGGVRRFIWGCLKVIRWSEHESEDGRDVHVEEARVVTPIPVYRTCTVPPKSL